MLQQYYTSWFLKVHAWLNHSKPNPDYCKCPAPTWCKAFLLIYNCFGTMVVLLLRILRISLQAQRRTRQIFRFISDSGDVRKWEPFVTLIRIVRDPGVVEPWHKQKCSKNGKSDACHIPHEKNDKSALCRVNNSLPQQDAENISKLPMMKYQRKTSKHNSEEV
jgi:hypothetical protein